MKKVLFATTNPGKVKLFSKGLLEKGIEALSLKDINITTGPEETGTTAVENALIKARTYYKETGMPTIGMDSTLYLEGVPEEYQPGLFVRRVNGKELSDEEMIKHYIGLVKKYGENGRINCKWVNSLAVINEQGEEKTYSWSIDNFYMVDEPSEVINPGTPLNSISKYKDTDKYFTEVTEEYKEKIEVNKNGLAEFIAESIGIK